MEERYRRIRRRVRRVSILDGMFDRRADGRRVKGLRKGSGRRGEESM